MDERLDGVPAQPEGQPQPQPVPQPVPQSPPQSPPGAAPHPGPQPLGAYGPPAAPVAAQWPSPAQPTGVFIPPPPPSGGRGGAGRAVLWAVVGAVTASALWAGGVFLLGRDDSPTADLRGYEAKANLCSSVDYSSVESEYQRDDNPLHHSLAHGALDQSYCGLSLERSAGSYSSAYLSVTVDLHKKTDPAPEFTALWSEYDQRYEDYDIEKLSGFGDEAYLVTSEPSEAQYATLAVRDGWMTYEMSWSIYTSSYDEDDETPELSDVETWLKNDTKATLEKLRSD